MCLFIPSHGFCWSLKKQRSFSGHLSHMYINVYSQSVSQLHFAYIQPSFYTSVECNNLFLGHCSSPSTKFFSWTQIRRGRRKVLQATEGPGITALATGEPAERHFKGIINSSNLTDALEWECNRLATAHANSNTGKHTHTSVCTHAHNLNICMHTVHTCNPSPEWGFQPLEWNLVQLIFLTPSKSVKSHLMLNSVTLQAPPVSMEWLGTVGPEREDLREHLERPVAPVSQARRVSRDSARQRCAWPRLLTPHRDYRRRERSKDPMFRGPVSP